MSTPIPSRQEMLDRAVRGLRAQGFARSVRYGICSYDNGVGKKCAWGHVDPEGTQGQGGSVAILRMKKIGLAGRLSLDDLEFAADLQHAHDASLTPEEMVSALHNITGVYGLTYPEPEANEPKDPS